MKKLTDKQFYLLKLVKRSQHEQFEGWAPVSKCLWDLIPKIPTDLVEVRPIAEHQTLAGHVRLTQEGETLVKWF
jgi:hypothetical protein